MAILDDFKARFPDFDEADADQYVPIFENVWPAYFNREYEPNKEIVLNLIAHLIVMEQQDGAGPLQSAQSKSTGSVSASYHPRESGRLEDFFASTKYGQRYLLLTRTRYGVGALFV